MKNSNDDKKIVPVILCNMVSETKPLCVKGKNIAVSTSPMPDWYWEAYYKPKIGE